MSALEVAGLTDSGVAGAEEAEDDEEEEDDDEEEEDDEEGEEEASQPHRRSIGSPSGPRLGARAGS
jgi:hypothetical protein